MTNTTEKTTNKWSIKTLVTVAIMAAVCCILGPWAVPIGPIPVSLCVIAVYLCAYILGPVKGTVACLIYLLLGLVGLPVFTGAQGGLAKFAGPTGGYLIGYLFLCFITGLFVEKFQQKKSFLQIPGMILGLAACYLFGTAWYVISAHVTVAQALVVCVYPFLIFDAIKIVISFLLGNLLRRNLQRAQLI